MCIRDSTGITGQGGVTGVSPAPRTHDSNMLSSTNPNGMNGRVWLPGGTGPLQGLPEPCNRFSYIQVSADMQQVRNGSINQKGIYVPCYFNV